MCNLSRYGHLTTVLILILEGEELLSRQSLTRDFIAGIAIRSVNSAPNKALQSDA